MTLLEMFEKQGNWLFRYRSFLPIVILVVGILVYVENKLYPGNYSLEGSAYLVYYELFCLAVSFFGLFIRIYTVGYTPSNTSGRNTKEQVADCVNTTGMYSFVRHPLYLGNFFMWLGPALLTAHFWFIVSFCFFYWLYYERIMFAEEQFLKRKFGTAYTDWASKHPAFIPKFACFKKPDLCFSWKKVVKKEKNGLLAIFLVFSLFDILGNLVQKSVDFNYYLLGALALTLLSYLILKYLKSNTNLLNEAGR